MTADDLYHRFSIEFLKGRRCGHELDYDWLKKPYDVL